MKIYAYILIILFGVLTAQCEKEILEENQDIPSSDKENEDFCIAVQKRLLRAGGRRDRSRA